MSKKFCDLSLLSKNDYFFILNWKSFVFQPKTLAADPYLEKQSYFLKTSFFLSKWVGQWLIWIL